MIDLEKECENFNTKLHTKGQAPEPQTPQHKATQEIIAEKTVSTQEVEHIRATPTSEIVLRIEDRCVLYPNPQSCRQKAKKEEEVGCYGCYYSR